MSNPFKQNHAQPGMHKNKSQQVGNFGSRLSQPVGGHSFKVPDSASPFAFQPHPTSQHSFFSPGFVPTMDDAAGAGRAAPYDWDPN